MVDDVLVHTQSIIQGPGWGDSPEAAAEQEHGMCATRVSTTRVGAKCAPDRDQERLHAKMGPMRSATTPSFAGSNGASNIAMMWSAPASRNSPARSASAPGSPSVLTFTDISISA